MKKTNLFSKLLAAAVIAGVCLFTATSAEARPGYGPRYGYGPRPHHHHPHHHYGPSRGWYNGALIVDATLGVLDILTRPLTTTTTTYVQPQPQVIYQQPATTVVTPAAPTVYYTPQTVPVVQQTIWR